MVTKKNKRGNMPNVLAEEMIPANLNIAQAIIVRTAKNNYAVHQKDSAAEVMPVGIDGADRKILQTNLDMYKKRLLQFMLVLLLFTTVSCKDEDVPSGNGFEVSPTADTTLVGTWKSIPNQVGFYPEVIFILTFNSLGKAFSKVYQDDFDTDKIVGLHMMLDDMHFIVDENEDKMYAERFGDYYYPNPFHSGFNINRITNDSIYLSYFGAVITLHGLQLGYVFTREKGGSKL